ncbi:MAG: zinc ribbon domain-containing protein [Oscillospiraceae bacterium]|nr:zinc ribbon domain-containing protein [Oscillospiraceae bacterium]
MICAHCGHHMLDGFKFCHHCGQPAAASVPEPEPAYIPALPEEPLPDGLEDMPGEEPAGLAEPPSVPSDADGGISAGRVFCMELLCRIPILNFFLLVIMATGGRGGALREYARGKLLAAMTVWIVVLLAALTVIFLIALEIIEPIYLGRWRI